MPGPVTISGARILVYVNGRLFGRCTSFNWTSNTPRRALRVIDIPHAVELMPTTVGVNWTMGMVRTIGDGGAQGAGIVNVDQAILSKEKYFTLQLIERRSGLTIFKSDLNNCDSESWVISPKNLMVGQAQGQGIVWVNEVAAF